jgi:GTPase Era involved in 16S rRNA processing
MASNKNIVLIMGKPNMGKSTSLMKLRNQEKMVYLNTDLKALPFQDRFMQNVEVSDARDVLTYINEIEQHSDVTGVVLDTITFLMSMYERQYVVDAVDIQSAWGAYGNFYREFIHAIKSGTKDYAILAHEDSVLNEQSMQMDTKVPIKGAVGRTGVEADFTTILAAKQMPVSKLEEHANDLLHITVEEREDGLKYVFCTRVTKETAGEKMRSAIGLWKRNELYIDNDLDQVFTRLRQYYNNGVGVAA